MSFNINKIDPVKSSKAGAAKQQFNRVEEKILEFWKSNGIFEKTLENRKKSKTFVFFEGPPTANGKPGIHHFIGRAFKDLFVRYKTMRGYNVTRKAGWDTHGLPVEIEVEKELGLKSKKEIESYGIARFNARAKESVWRYKDEWERFTKRIGFWLDLKNPYITYDKDYIETLWHIIQRISKRKLLYKGHKVLHWCPRCGTALSSHEVAQGYENVADASLYVKFKLLPGQKFGKAGQFITKDSAYVLSWTTTPWTLPGNVALAVGKDINYTAIRVDGAKELYIIAQDLVEKVFAGRNIERVHNFKGDLLAGLSYEPLFEVPALKSKNSYKIYPAEFVTTEEGTGVVHIAVMYGEDDYELGKKFDLPMRHTVNEDGKFTDDMPEGLSGRFVKDEGTEKIIISHLKERGYFLKEEKYSHDYPFCWRCKTPLLYYAKDSWFVAMSRLRKDLLKNNKKVNWIPGHLKEGRFGEFLREVKDWAISRERYWGTPLPIWFCSQNQMANRQPPTANCQPKGCGNYIVIGSYEELHKNAYRKPNTYFYMRHGNSTKNDHGLISSRLENDTFHLTEGGREEVKKEAEKLKKGGLDLIITSPFLRTKETAEIVSKITGAEMIIDNRLHELDHGSACEGKKYYVCISEGSEFPRDLNYKFGDGESWMDVRKRMAAVLKELKEKHEGKRILIVSHGDPLAILKAIADGSGDDELFDTLVPAGKNDFQIKKKMSLYPKKGQLYKLNFKNLPYDGLGYINPHRPFVDEIFLRCKKCKGGMTRVKDVADVWFDSGAMPFAQSHWPFSKKDFHFPADFIAEAVDQTRGWFYTLLAVSVLLKKGAPYKNVLSYSHVLDEKGRKMSKSIGNTVDPWDVISQFGADAARWYFYTVNSPGDPKLFNTKDLNLKLFGFIATLLNSLRFFELYYDKEKINLETHPLPANTLDKWIYARLESTNLDVSKSLDAYDPTGSSRAIEEFVVNDFSNWWIRRSRERFQRPQNAQELEKAISILRFLLLQISKLIAPFTPFIAEELHIQLHKGSSPGTLSIHMHDWPEPNKKYIDLKLEKEMSELRRLAALGLAKRKENNIKVRQPLLSVSLKDRIGENLEIYLKEELNVRGVLYNPGQKEDVLLDTDLTPDLIAEGYFREIIRKIQDMRKEAEYRFDQKVFARWYSENEEVRGAIRRFESKIKTDTILEVFEESSQHQHKFDIEKEFDIAPGRKIWIGIWSG